MDNTLTKHDALRSVLYTEMNLRRRELVATRERLEDLQRQLAEQQQELMFFPDVLLDEGSYADLASAAEDIAHLVTVPDVLFLEDATDDGTALVSADVLN